MSVHRRTWSYTWSCMIIYDYNHAHVIICGWMRACMVIYEHIWKHLIIQRIYMISNYNQTYMIICGRRVCIWFYMSIHEHIRNHTIYIILNDQIWLQTGTCNHIWLQIGIYGYLWAYKDVRDRINGYACPIFMTIYNYRAIFYLIIQ